MAKAPEAAVTANGIVFELERFEVEGADRLQLNGRWFGVRGRRFMRPTLTLALEGERFRALADLDDKPWAAEDGEPWTASFPWPEGTRPHALELSVAPDITIQLPAPSARRTRSQRLSALPRRDAMTASWGELGAAVEADVDASEVSDPAAAAPQPPIADEPVPAQPPDPEVLEAEIEDLHGQLSAALAARQGMTAELDAARGELGSLRARLEAVRQDLQSRERELTTARAELTAARSAQEVGLRSSARAEAERDAALTQAAEAEADRDTLAADHAALKTTLEQTKGMLNRLSREREDAVSARGAALVMRGATQALPASERHVGWLRRGLAVLVLLGVVFAALIVLNVL